MSAQRITVTQWETRIGVRVECLRCDFTALRAASSSAIKVAVEHAEETGHTVNITKVMNCTASGGGLRVVAPVEEPNPHVQRTWIANLREGLV